jgi:large subunit ribosomal protein L3e
MSCLPHITHTHKHPKQHTQTTQQKSTPADPRCGSLGYSPRQRCRRGHGKCKSFPRDDATKPPHLTAFMGFKAGMTHIVREVDKPGSKLHKKETCEPVTVIEAPPMVVIGVVGYCPTHRGLRSLSTVWAEHLDESVKRRFYKNWYKAKRKAFSRYAKKYASPQGVAADLDAIRKNCTVVRALAHTQVRDTERKKKRRFFFPCFFCSCFFGSSCGCLLAFLV